jgi:hypothetical protein
MMLAPKLRFPANAVVPVAPRYCTVVATLWLFVGVITNPVETELATDAV